MKHSLDLHRKLYYLLKKTGNMDHRHDIIFMNTEGRTENSSELTTEEIELLIHALETCGMEAVRPESDFLRGDTMRKRILSLFYQYGYTEFSAKKKRLVVDFERMDAWMLKYGYLHKNLNKYKYSELPKLVTQVEQVVTKYIESF